MMKKLQQKYQPHLVIQECVLLPGAEWAPQPNGWTFIQAGEGLGYYLQSNLSRELETGTVLLSVSEFPGCIRASRLSELSLSFFSVIPDRLTGLLTIGERSYLQTEAPGNLTRFRVLPPQSPVALKMKQLREWPNLEGVRIRLKLIELFVEAFAKEFEQKQPDGVPSSSRERLQHFLNTTPSSDLLELNIAELADIAHCTPRHLGRIFHDVTGTSFRDVQSELRLARALELLANTDAKIIDVALESGYKSLSLFNFMFSRQFGTSPSRWREKHVKSGQPQPFTVKQLEPRR
jgi:AraC-like DNA-binding protein